ncbi:MAG TPA: alanine--tRNA ligase [Candidatus Krumholzibacteria bacterium]|nr:alanine--tRNA ligase [Candidatus Krumholzibacteria bacterium]
MTSHEIRQAFLDFFAERGHEIVPSATLIPQDDPTLLFTNAGMNQFKALLLGTERRSYVRAADAQKCMRVSGKHNDLEAVGRDGRHHTFFEMLGNWSFGDYYKREAIEWAWEFLTKTMELDQDKLLISVYKDDDESFEIWNGVVGVPADRIHRLGDIEKGDEENFWSMGDTGPCGPCTEIHYDQGPELAQGDDRPLGENDSDRYLEIWNLVFIQYDRDGEGTMKPLPLQSVDTGMGLERLAALKQGVTSNYGTDLFTPILDWVARESGADRGDDEQRVSMQVIADHIRALTFAVADGGRPGNDGRGYVLRRILRRAVRHGRNLGFGEPFLYRCADVVIEQMGDHYRELREAREHVQRVIRVEEERFLQTLDRGLQRFGEFADQAVERGDRRITGEQAFMLHDTYGFPVDLTAVMAEEQDLTVDTEGFAHEMEKQRERARAAGKFQAGERGEEWRWIDGEPGADRASVRFVGYDTLRTEARILGVRPLDGDEYEVSIDPSPFYAESGGQVGDTGSIRGERLVLEVLDTQPGSGGPVTRVRLVEGSLERDDLGSLVVTAEVDTPKRVATMRNHTATHLLHAALHEHLGTHATQAGSLVNEQKLRFDFHHDGALGKEMLDTLEAEVNRQILRDFEVSKHVDVPIDDARAMGAIAMFGEKYGDTVRVVQVSDVSTEFCGGTHCDHTGQIGLFRITGESAVAAGVRRVEAVTGEAAVRLSQHEHAILRDLGERLSARPDEIETRVDSLQDEVKQLRVQLEEARKAQAGDVVGDLVAKADEVDGLKLVSARIDVPDRGALMNMADELRAKLGTGVGVLGTVLDGKGTLITVVTDDLVKDGLRAGDLIKPIAAVAGGGGGGKPHLAQAGAKQVDKLDDALAAARDVVHTARS